MKIVANKLLILSFIFLISCVKKYQFDSTGKLHTGYLTCYTSDSLQCSLQFSGSISMMAKIKMKIDEFQEHDKKILSKLRIGKKNTLVLFTALDPVDQINYIVLARKNFKPKNYDKIELNDKRYLLRKKNNNRDFLITEILIPYSNYYYSQIIYTPTTNQIDFIKKSMDEISIAVGELNLGRLSKKLKECSSIDPFSRLDELFQKNKTTKNYLAAENFMLFEDNYTSYREKSSFYQAMATYYSFAHQFKEVNESWDKLNKLDGFKKDTIVASFSPVRETILKKVQGSQVVMFNEAHHHSEHRYLVGSLLKDFYTLGFRYLALEGIVNADSLNESEYKIPCHMNGIYVRDPTYSNMLKNALDLGYKLVEYDSWEIADRELGQAQKLYNNTIKKDPTAKVLVLAGYDHIDEVPTGGKVWMAEKFQKFSGLNPITINQTDALSKIILINNDDEPSILENKCFNDKNDIYILNTISLDDKDNCFSSKVSKSITVEIERDSLIKNNKNVVCIYRKEDFEKTKSTLPTVVKVMDIGQNEFSVRLCIGSYIIECKDFYGQIIFSKNLIVD